MATGTREARIQYSTVRLVIRSVPTIRASSVLSGVFLLAALAATAGAQAPTPQAPAQVPASAPHAAASPVPRVVAPPPITVDGSEQFFATMCALYAAGYQSDVSAADWRPLRAQLRDFLQKQEGPAVEALRDFYKQHELADPGATLSRYIWFALVAGPAPRFAPTPPRDEMPPEALALDGFSEILANYYKEQKIGQLWRQVQPVYDREIARLHEPVSQMVMVSTGYLREILPSSSPRAFSLIVEPLVGRKTNVRNFAGHYAIILGATGEPPIDVIRHAYLHFLLDSIPLRYSHVVAVKRPLLEFAARAPRLPVEFKDDFSAFFTECLVRAVELRLGRLSPGQLAATIDTAEADGFVLVRPLVRELSNFEKAEPSMTLYFPDLVRAIDTPAEAKRLETVKFAARQETAPDAESGAGEVTRAQRAAPAGIPNDSEAIAALTEGERQISLKNARAAEAAFRKVLEKYPDQPRARYGIALAALLAGDETRARELLGGLVTGGTAARSDPMVLSWSHIYLARLLEGDGERQKAAAEYGAALAVEGAPERAREAARRGLEKAGGEAPPEKP